MKYGDRLKVARTHAKLRQEDLAEMSGASQQTISYLENSEASGSEFTVQFAEACGVRPQWLAIEQGDMVDGMVVDDPRLKAALKDPKKVNVLLLMEPLPAYAVDHVIKDIAEITELIEQSRQAARSG